MNVIIPASGEGKRFKEAGYKGPKYFLKVNKNKRVLDYILENFNKDDNIYLIGNINDKEFIENNENFKKYKVNVSCYTGEKLGPSNVVLDFLEKNPQIKEDILISYCDFGFKCNMDLFRDYVKKFKYVIPYYQGYFTHLKTSNDNYAALKVFGSEVFSVEEKYNSKDRFNEFWSPGLYYFESAEVLIHAIKKQKEANDYINGEFYCSTLYNYITEKTYPFKIDQFYQFGTPKDFEIAKSYLNTEKENDFTEDVIVLAAGKCERFKNLNYAYPKPFLDINGEPLINKIKNSFKKANKIYFIGSKAHENFWKALKYDVQYVPENKKGAAYSYKVGTQDLKLDKVLITPCDVLFNYDKKLKNTTVFAAKPTKYQLDHKESFSWITEDGNIGLKKYIEGSYVLIGAFYVKHKLLLEAIDKMYELEMKINNEYYLDTAFKIIKEDFNKKIDVVLVDKYLSFGTPEEYEENKLWAQE
jgi:nucleotidyl transferase family protein